MPSVTQRIKSIKQPRGGYLKPARFTTTILNNDDTILQCENVNPITVGLVVDYMTRVRIGEKKINDFDIKDVFRISLKGASLVDKPMYDYAIGIVELIEANSASILTIKECCKLVTFDSKYRSGIWSPEYLVDISESDATIIHKLIDLSILFFEEYGPFLESGMTFEGGYTETVSTGDADFITQDTLWDFKASKNKILPRYTLQLYMYFLMGLNSNQNILFKSLQYIGFYNPIRNEVIRLEINDIEAEIKEAVLYEVLGYEKN